MGWGYGGFGGDQNTNGQAGSAGVVIVKYISGVSVIQKTLTYRYLIKRQPQKTLTENYRIMRQSTKPLSLNYRIKRQPQNTLSLNYTLNLQIVRTQYLPWKYQIKFTIVPKETTFDYRLSFEGLQKGLNFSYRIQRQPIVNTTFSYLVRRSGYADIMNFFNRMGFNRMFFNRAGALNATGYRLLDVGYWVLTQHSLELSTNYKIEKTSTKSLSLDYWTPFKTTTLLVNTMSYTVLVSSTETYKTISISYMVNYQQQVTLEMSYLSIVPLHADLSVSYNVISQQVTSLSLTYGLPSQFPSPVICAILDCELEYPKEEDLKCNMSYPKTITITCRLKCK